MLQHGVCCSRTELLSHVWHSTPEAGTNVVDVYVTYLRKKLAAAHPEENPSESAIETVRGSGYRLRDKRRITRFEKPVVQNQVEQDEVQAPTRLAYGA